MIFDLAKNWFNRWATILKIVRSSLFKNSFTLNSARVIAADSVAAVRPDASRRVVHEARRLDTGVAGVADVGREHAAGVTGGRGGRRGGRRAAERLGGRDAGRRGAACRTQQSACSPWTGETYTWRRRRRRRDRALSTLLLGALLTPSTSIIAHRRRRAPTRSRRDASRRRPASTKPGTFERVKVAASERIRGSQGYRALPVVWKMFPRRDAWFRFDEALMWFDSDIEKIDECDREGSLMIFRSRAGIVLFGLIIPRMIRWYRYLKVIGSEDEFYKWWFFDEVIVLSNNKKVR